MQPAGLRGPSRQQQEGNIAMTVRTVAVCITTMAEAGWLLPLACDFARARGAHLIGVHPSEPVIPYVAATAGIGALAAPQFLDWQIEETDAIRDRFAQVTRGDSFVAEWREQGPADLGAEDFLLDSVRAADVVVVGAPDREMPRADHQRYFDALVRRSGRPVLLFPKSTDAAAIGSRIAIGWSDTREATRAAHDARLLAHPKAAFDIVYIARSTSGRDETCRTDLAAALDRQGFKARVVEAPRGAEETSAQLCRMAREGGADVLAVGAYGHSLVYDFVVGAVTRQLYGSAELPVLFSH
jgi:nucleotide-binding universal stress UspA family protein